MQIENVYTYGSFLPSSPLSGAKKNDGFSSSNKKNLTEESGDALS
jgi:hypothetical protein